MGMPSYGKAKLRKDQVSGEGREVQITGRLSYRKADGMRRLSFDKDDLWECPVTVRPSNGKAQLQEYYYKAGLQEI